MTGRNQESVTSMLHRGVTLRSLTALNESAGLLVRVASGDKSNEEILTLVKQPGERHKPVTIAQKVGMIVGDRTVDDWALGIEPDRLGFIEDPRETDIGTIVERLRELAPDNPNAVTALDFLAGQGLIDS